MRKRTAAIAGVVVVTVGVSQLLFGSATTHANVGSNAYPYVISTPSFVLDEPGIVDVRVTSAEDKDLTVLYRFYRSDGTLQHSNDQTVDAHGSREISVVLQDGGRMHLEIWSPRPAVALEIEYDGTDDLNHEIPPGDVVRAKRI